MSESIVPKQFSIGVGGAVCRDNRLLMVKHNYGPKRWQIPGGRIEIHETIHQAVQREVLEETSIHAIPEGIFAVRHRLNEADNNLYVVFKCHTEDTCDPVPDGHEVSAAAFLTLEEIDTLADSWKMNRLLARAVLDNEPHLFLDRGDPEKIDDPNRRYFLFA